MAVELRIFTVLLLKNIAQSSAENFNVDDCFGDSVMTRHRATRVPRHSTAWKIRSLASTADCVCMSGFCSRPHWGSAAGSRWGLTSQTSCAHLYLKTLATLLAYSLCSEKKHQITFSFIPSKPEKFKFIQKLSGCVCEELGIPSKSKLNIHCYCLLANI